ncbi:hypothetical protein D3C76_950040 [compost metagenome]
MSSTCQGLLGTAGSGFGESAAAGVLGGSALALAAGLDGWLANSFCQSSWPSASSAAQVSSLWLRILPTTTCCLARSTVVSLMSRRSSFASGRPSGALIAKGATLTERLFSSSSVCLARLSL